MITGKIVIEVGSDHDGGNAAALCRESSPKSTDRSVIMTFYALPFWNPLAWVISPKMRAQAWALGHGFGRPPVVEAWYVL